MRHILHPHRKAPTPYTRALREVLHPAKGEVHPTDVTRQAWKETHTPERDPSRWPTDPHAPQGEEPAQWDTANPDTAYLDLEQQARQRYPYPECNQWGGVPPEYLRDCLEVDRKRKAWIAEQKPTPNPGETHTKPMGSAYTVQVTDPQGNPGIVTTVDHVGHGPVIVHTPDPQYFTNDTLRPTPKEGIMAREEGEEEQWKRRELDRHREQMPKIPPFPSGGYIPSLEEGLIPKSLQDAIARAAGKTAEEMRKVVEDACALKTPRRPCLEDLPLADLYALWRLLRRLRKLHRKNLSSAATLDHKILAVYNHIHNRLNQIDY